MIRLLLIFLYQKKNAKKNGLLDFHLVFEGFHGIQLDSLDPLDQLDSLDSLYPRFIGLIRSIECIGSIISIGFIGFNQIDCLNKDDKAENESSQEWRRLW